MAGGWLCSNLEFCEESEANMTDCSHGRSSSFASNLETYPPACSSSLGSSPPHLRCDDLA